MPTPQEICWFCVVLGYSPGWAVYKIQEIYGQAEREPIFAFIEKNSADWRRYFQNRWGIQEEKQESRERQTKNPEQSVEYALSYQGYLEVLQLSFPFTYQELKSAYRRRARETHPDSGGTAEAFREVHAAYQILWQSYSTQ